MASSDGVFTDLLCEGLCIVNDSEDGNLPFGFRLRMWDEMARHFPTDGQVRNAVLDYWVARDLLPKWEALGLASPYLEIPRTLLRHCRDVIKGRLSREDGKKLLAGDWPLDEATARSGDAVGDQMRASFAAYAAHAALATAADLYWPEHEGLTYDATEYDADPCYLDVHANAAFERAGALWDPASNVVARAAYWTEWLTKRFPRILEDIKDVIAIIDRYRV